MNSRERVKRAFSHQEPDRVPVFDLEVNSFVASEIMGRPMRTGGGNLKKAAVKAGEEGRLQLALRIISDTVELVRKLDLDIFVLPDLPLGEGVLREVAENSWIYDDGGFWRKMRYTPKSDMCSEVDSLICQEGLPGLRRYVEHLKRSPSTGTAKPR